MPRRWTNSSGGGGGSVRHHFVLATPFRMQGEKGPVDLWEVDRILVRNAKVAGHENKEQKRFRQ